MKGRIKKHLSLYLLVILLGMYMLPVSVRAEEEIALSTFEELKEACSGASRLTGTSLLCTTEGLVFSEDFEIPSGIIITLRSFTVPEGITLTVGEAAEIRTYAFTVQGTLINQGKVTQQDLSATWAGDEDIAFALIPGHVDNQGTMVLTDVFGTRNINRFGGKLMINETGSYADKRRIIFSDEDPAQATEPIHTPMPTPPSPANSPVQEVFGLLEVVLPRLAFFLVLACLFIVIKVGIDSSRKGKQRKRGSAFPDPAVEPLMRNGFSGEDHFQRDKRKRMEQLDEWLKSGLIDRKEYKELKRRYQEDL